MNPGQLPDPIRRSIPNENVEQVSPFTDERALDDLCEEVLGHQVYDDEKVRGLLAIENPNAEMNATRLSLNLLHIASGGGDFLKPGNPETPFESYKWAHRTAAIHPGAAARLARMKVFDTLRQYWWGVLIVLVLVFCGFLYLFSSTGEVEERTIPQQTDLGIGN